MSRDNPLPPGEIACTEPIEGLVLGTHLVLDQIGSFDGPLLNPVTESFASPEIDVDVTTLAFDLEYPTATGGRIAGVYSFVSESPCAAVVTPIPPISPILPPAPTPALDFFGTVVSVSSDVLEVNSQGEIVTVVTTTDTQIKLPRIPNATLADLSQGDVVAVSLIQTSTGLVADKIHLIPGKTKFRHFPGQLVELSADQITIQPPGKATGPMTFSLTPNTDIRVHRNAPALAVGSFVIVGAARALNDADLATVQLVPNALEVNITGRKVRAQVAAPVAPSVTPPQATAKIQGVFQGVNSAGQWIIGETPVTLDPATLIDDGLVAGQVLEVEALIQEDGSLLAQNIEDQEPGTDVAATTKLEGVFQGIDQASGDWIISGALVAVGPGTDTDGVPAEGQAVEVKAVLQDDGSLLAREVENQVDAGLPQAGEAAQAKLEGTFQGIDSEGNWLINGAAVAVDPLTKLEGTPEVGGRVEVKATVQDDGTLLATKIESEEKNTGKPEGRARAKVRGVIQQVFDDGSVQINGISIALSALTDIAQAPQSGDLVEVDALIQAGGALIAREIEDAALLGAEELAEPSKVDIRGVIDAVNSDGSVVVNGITVALSALSDVQGDLVKGKQVKVKGLFSSQGQLIASAVKGKGRGATGKATEAKIQGQVEQVNLNQAGEVASLVVDGITVEVEALTEADLPLVTGAIVEIDAVVIEGRFSASKIEKPEKPGPSSKSEIKLEGAIQALQTDNQGRVISVEVNGIQVALAALNRAKGSLEVGQTVEIETSSTGGVLRASRVETKQPKPAKQKLERFQIEGLVEVVQRDGAGNLVGLVVDGKTIAAEDLTKIKGSITEGAKLEVKGVISDGVLLADKIEAKKSKSEEDGPGKSQGAGNGKGKSAEAESKSQGASNGKGKSAEAASKGQGASKDKGKSAEPESKSQGASKDKSQGKGSGKTKKNDTDSSGASSGTTEGSGSGSSGSSTDSSSSNTSSADSSTTSGGSSDSSGSGSSSTGSDSSGSGSGSSSADLFTESHCATVVEALRVE